MSLHSRPADRLKCNLDMPTYNSGLPKKCYGVFQPDFWLTILCGTCVAIFLLNLSYHRKWVISCTPNSKWYTTLYCKLAFLPTTPPLLPLSSLPCKLASELGLMQFGRITELCKICFIRFGVWSGETSSAAQSTHCGRKFQLASHGIWETLFLLNSVQGLTQQYRLASVFPGALWPLIFVLGNLSPIIMLSPLPKEEVEERRWEELVVPALQAFAYMDLVIKSRRGRFHAAGDRTT